jgi:hypothetical protein
MRCASGFHGGTHRGRDRLSVPLLMLNGMMDCLEDRAELGAIMLLLALLTLLLLPDASSAPLKSLHSASHVSHVGQQG